MPRATPGLGNKKKVKNSSVLLLYNVLWLIREYDVHLRNDKIRPWEVH